MSASFAQAVFFSSNSDTSLALQTHLFDAIRDLDHPDKGRFGSHFLLFPLLAVNKHLRKEVAKYLYKHVFQEYSPALINKDWKERSKLTLQRWTINGELRDEENDPRFLWTYSGLRRHKNPALTLYPASFDASSVSLDVTYTVDEDDPCVLSIETMEDPTTGRCHYDLPSGFVLASSAAFTHASEKLQQLNQDMTLFDISSMDPGALDDFDLDDDVVAAAMTEMQLGYETSDAERWGLRSAVPFPAGDELRVDHTNLLIPRPPWPCTQASEPIQEKDALFTGGFTISYSAKIHDVEDFHDEYMSDLMAPCDSEDELEDAEDAGDDSESAAARQEARWDARIDARVEEYEAQREKQKKSRRGIVRDNLVALRVQEVRAPMMRFLKPSITRHELSKRSDNY